jgi:hypothetical protein
MQLFDDVVMLEFLKDEYESDSRSSIILPDAVKEKLQGRGNSLISPHYFKVVAVGPDCKRVKPGDRIFPKPPTFQNPSAFQACLVWIDSKKEERYIVHESSIAGVE